MEELESTERGVVIRLKCDDVDLLLSALNEALETVADWEFSARTGFERNEFRAMQKALQAVRSKMADGRRR